MKLRNKSKKRPIMACNPLGPPDICPPGKTMDFNGENPGVRILALAGDLVSADAESKRWLEDLRGQAHAGARV